jgi:hypothetical protein
MKEDIQKYFADHVIIEQNLTADGKSGYYRIKNPAESAYWFRVTFAPGMFVMDGDIGELVVNKPLSWLSLSTLNSESYFLSKTAFTESLFDFDSEGAKEELESIKKETQDEKIIDACDEGIYYLNNNSPFYDYRASVNEFLNVASDAWEDTDYPSFKTPSSSTQFKIAALKKFVELLGLKDE